MGLMGPLSSSTINCYISHVINLLINRRLIDDSSQWRTTRNRFLGQALKRRDITIKHDYRKMVKIDVTLPIVLMAARLAQRIYNSDPTTAEATGIAMLFGLCFATRPGEYLHPHEQRFIDSPNNITGDQLAFWFDSINDAVQITYPQDYPPGEWPTFMIYKPLVDKANMFGGMGARAISANPNLAQSGRCNLRSLFTFFVHNPPPPGRSVFHAVPAKTDLYTRVNETLKLTAKELGLNPSQLLPHGLRSGAVSQCDGASDDDRMQIGGWRSSQGFHHYAKFSTALVRASRLGTQMNDEQRVTAAVIKHIYKPIPRSGQINNPLDISGCNPPAL